MSSTHKAIANAVPVDPPTDEELGTIWDEYDTLIIPVGGAGTPNHVHLPHPHDSADPWCRSTGGVDTGWTDKPIGVYPPGWKKLCGKCLSVWRAEI